MHFAVPLFRRSNDNFPINFIFGAVSRRNEIMFTVSFSWHYLQNNIVQWAYDAPPASRLEGRHPSPYLHTPPLGACGPSILAPAALVFQPEPYHFLKRFGAHRHTHWPVRSKNSFGRPLSQVTVCTIFFLLKPLYIQTFLRGNIHICFPLFSIRSLKIVISIVVHLNMYNLPLVTSHSSA